MTTTVLPVDPLPVLELQRALVRHLQQCKQARGRWFSTASLAERAHGLLAPRFVTTVVGATSLLALCRWWT